METKMEKETKEIKIILIKFDNHMPIRIKDDYYELWLGYDFSDFGGRYLKAYKNQKGEYLIWYRCNSGYTTGKSFNHFIGKYRPGEIDIIAGKTEMRTWLRIDRPRDENGDTWPANMEEIGKIQVWLESIGLSKVEEF
jgi:hypothetical protein